MTSGIVLEKEITVEINVDLETIKSLLESQNFKVIQEYDMKDIYMVKSDCDLKKSALDILKDCLLVRHIEVDTRVIDLNTYKYKEYNDKGDILQQGKAECHVVSIEEAKKLLNAIGYNELMIIKDHLIIYSNEEIELALQCVNDKHIYIEVEDKQKNKIFKTIDEMKEELLKYNFPIKGNNFFVKKAEIELLENLNGERL